MGNPEDRVSCNEVLLILQNIFMFDPFGVQKSNHESDLLQLYDFINLTHVHNFMVNAQDIFTFGRLPLFSVSLSEI